MLNKLTQFKLRGGGRNKFQQFLLNWLHGYNHEKYWHRRSIIIDPTSKSPTIVKIYYMLWLKRIDAKHHCSFGTFFNRGSVFETPPTLPHGPNGIICGYDAKIGKKCRIYHQVTIADGNVTIGDYTEIGAGAKILSGVKIGSHCHIGANAVVVEDMPDYSTCVLSKPRIIIKPKPN